MAFKLPDVGGYVDDLDGGSVALGAAVGVVGALVVTALYPKDVYTFLQNTGQVTTKALNKARAIVSMPSLEDGGSGGDSGGDFVDTAFDFNMVPNITILA